MFLKKLIFITAFALVNIPYLCAQLAHTNIIPQPQSISLGNGFFELDARTVVLNTTNLIDNNTQIVLAGIESKTGYLLKQSAKLGKKNQLILKTNKALASEEYVVNVTEKEVVCEASTSAGMFYAIQSILQSLTKKGDKYGLPTMLISDSPAYTWRGMMLDESRHFFGKETVKQLLDVMAYLKLNLFHMHLTDENGWRVEIKKYPKLTGIGAEGNWSDSKAPAKFYTQDDIREIIAYARERHIMVIPEIDMPGHASAAARAYPEISAGGTGRWQGFTFHPAKETTYQFIDDVLTEVADLFPAPYIHIGGDEVHYGNKVWFTDSLIQQFIKDNELKNEVGLEHYFVRRVCDIVNKKGKTAIGWDEIIESGVSPDKAIVMWWRHDKPEQLTKALERGFKVVLTPRLPCYMDFVQDDSHKIGRRWGEKFNRLSDIYDFPNSRKSLLINNKSQIMGLQACVWTERIADVKRLQFMIFPRLAAIAEDGWTLQEYKDYPLFEKRIKSFLQYLNAKGIYYFNPFDKESTPEPWGPTKPDIIAEG